MILVGLGWDYELECTRGISPLRDFARIVVVIVISKNDLGETGKK